MLHPRWLDGDALTLAFDQYAASLKATVKDGALDGTYFRAGYTPCPVHGTPFTPARAPEGSVPSIAGLWTVPVQTKKGRSAWRFVVRQSGADVSASILRIDGDTGALTGSFRDGKFVLSHFSGARPTVVEVKRQPDGTLAMLHNGTAQLTAIRSSEARAKNVPEPPDPFHFTVVKDPVEPFRFGGPDLNGKLIQSTDAQFRGKVVIVAISGSWCPNCHDEAPFLEALYEKYRGRGLEVVALAFEEGEQLTNPTRLRAFIKEYGVRYTVLVAGEPGDLKEKVPQAADVSCWPTTFFINRDGLVKGVHAGFAGKATGALHDKEGEEVSALVENLLTQDSRTSR